MMLVSVVDPELGVLAEICRLTSRGYKLISKTGDLTLPALA